LAIRQNRLNINPDFILKLKSIPCASIHSTIRVLEPYNLLKTLNMLVCYRCDFRSIKWITALLIFIQLSM